jgi:hypothetical protein
VNGRGCAVQQDLILCKKIIRHAHHMSDNPEGKGTAARQHGGGMLISGGGLTPRYQ